jgi:hypothetical protein
VKFLLPSFVTEELCQRRLALEATTAVFECRVDHAPLKPAGAGNWTGVTVGKHATPLTMRLSPQATICASSKRLAEFFRGNHLVRPSKMPRRSFSKVASGFLAGNPRSPRWSA